MATALEEARERARAAKEAAAAAKLTDEESELARYREEEEAANAELRSSNAVRRANELKTRETAARKVAAGKYLVRGVDLADHLPPEADLATVPNRGLWVVRSPTREAVRSMNADIEAKDKPQDVWTADLVCASVVDPPNGAALNASDADKAAGAEVRGFCDDERNMGAVTQLANHVTDLNGTKQKEAKRGRK